MSGESVLGSSGVQTARRTSSWKAASGQERDIAHDQDPCRRGRADLRPRRLRRRAAGPACGPRASSSASSSPAPPAAAASSSPPSASPSAPASFSADGSGADAVAEACGVEGGRAERGREPGFGPNRKPVRRHPGAPRGGGDRGPRGASGRAHRADRFDRASEPARLLVRSGLDGMGHRPDGLSGALDRRRSRPENPRPWRLGRDPAARSPPGQWTDADQPTVWLAVHIRGGDGT